MHVNSWVISMRDTDVCITIVVFSSPQPSRNHTYDDYIAASDAHEIM